jgi:hypothetical protein
VIRSYTSTLVDLVGHRARGGGGDLLGGGAADEQVAVAGETAVGDRAHQGRTRTGFQPVAGRGVHALLDVRPHLRLVHPPAVTEAPGQLCHRLGSAETGQRPRGGRAVVQDQAVDDHERGRINQAGSGDGGDRVPAGGVPHQQRPRPAQLVDHRRQIPPVLLRRRRIGAAVAVPAQVDGDDPAGGREPAGDVVPGGGVVADAVHQQHRTVIVTAVVQQGQLAAVDRDADLTGRHVRCPPPVTRRRSRR